MKPRAVVVVALTFGVSLVLVDELLFRIALAATAAVLVGFLLRIPTSA